MSERENEKERKKGREDNVYYFKLTQPSTAMITVRENIPMTTGTTTTQ